MKKGGHGPPEWLSYWLRTGPGEPDQAATAVLGSKAPLA
jgi:hypothetical protein